MAYFGRKPKKPGSVPGAASGGHQGSTSVQGTPSGAPGSRTARPDRVAARARVARPALQARQARTAR